MIRCRHVGCRLRAVRALLLCHDHGEELARLADVLDDMARTRLDPTDARTA